MAEPRILAIDVGTTGARAIVFDASGRSHGSSYKEIRSQYPQPGRAEQDPEHIWAVTEGVCRAALESAGTKPAELAAVGVANQRSSILGWDASTLEPVGPMITWQDTRGTARAEELSAEGYFVNPNVSVTKAEWIVRNVPSARELAEAGRLRMGGAETWAIARLTGGAHVTDHSNASASGFYAHFENDWEKNLLAAVGVPETAMPELVDSSGPIAETDEAVFGAKVPIAGLCADQQASAYGLRCHDAGMSKCTFGTSAMVDLVVGPNLELGGEGTYPLIGWKIGEDRTWLIEGNVITAGAAIQWLRDGLGVLEDAGDADAAARSVEDCGGVWAVPAFEGLGTPVMDAAARATIGGLSRGSTRGHVVRAMLEGIAHRVADVGETLWQERGAPAALRVDGGASRNDFLLQFQADILGVPVQRSAEADGTALGAAMLAARGVGLDDPGARDWKPERVFEPQATSERRAELRARWKHVLSAAAIGTF
jgi:glycerol kinase